MTSSRAKDTGRVRKWNSPTLKRHGLSSLGEGSRHSTAPVPVAHVSRRRARVKVRVRGAHMGLGVGAGSKAEYRNERWKKPAFDEIKPSGAHAAARPASGRVLLRAATGRFWSVRTSCDYLSWTKKIS